MADTTKDNKSYRAEEGHLRAGVEDGGQAGLPTSLSSNRDHSRVDDQAQGGKTTTGKKEENTGEKDEDIEVVYVESKEERDGRIREEKVRRREVDRGGGIKRTAGGISKEIKKERLDEQEGAEEGRDNKVEWEGKVGEKRNESGSDSDQVRSKAKKKKNWRDDFPKDMGQMTKEQHDEFMKRMETEESDWETETENESTEESEEEYRNGKGDEELKLKEEEIPNNHWEIKGWDDKNEKQVKKANKSIQKLERMRKKIEKIMDQLRCRREIKNDIKSTLEEMEKEGDEMRRIVVESNMEMGGYKKTIRIMRRMEKGKAQRGKEREEKMEIENKEQDKVGEKENGKLEEMRRRIEELEKENKKMKEDMIEDRRKGIEERDRWAEERNRWTKLAENYRKEKGEIEEVARKIEDKERRRQKKREEWEEKRKEEEEEVKKKMEKAEEKEEQYNHLRRKLIIRTSERDKELEKLGKTSREWEKEATEMGCRLVDKEIQTEKLEVTYKEALDMARKGGKGDKKKAENEKKQEQEGKQEWSKVTRRGREETRRGEGQGNDRSGDRGRGEEERNGGRRENVQSKREDRTRKRSKIRVRREAIIIRTKTKEEGDEIMNEFRGEYGTENEEEIRTIRRTRNGNLLVEMENRGETEKLKNKLEKVAKGRAIVTEKKPTIDMEIDDIEAYIRKEEVMDRVFEEYGEGDKGEMRLKVMKGMGTGMSRAVIEVPMTWRQKIIGKDRIRIGYTRCRVKEGSRVMRCFKCNDVGHISYFCRKEMEQTGTCRRCGTKGHEIEECRGTQRCHICAERGVPEYRLNHNAGTNRCRLEKEKIENKSRGGR